MLAAREDLCELRKFQANYQRLWRFISASISSRASGQCFAATIISSRQSVSLQSTSYKPPGGSPALLITGAPARTSCTTDPGCVLSSKQARDSALIRIVMSYFFHRCRSRSNPDCPDQTVIECAFRVNRNRTSANIGVSSTYLGASCASRLYILMISGRQSV
jgi:hypothetical protein